jgi:hypothetical protein
VARDLASFAVAVFDTFLEQDSSRRRIEVVTDFLCGGCGGGDFKLLCPAGFFDHILQNIFRHRAPADVSVTDEKHLYFIHTKSFLQNYKIFLTQISQISQKFYSSSHLICANRSRREQQISQIGLWKIKSAFSAVSA